MDNHYSGMPRQAKLTANQRFALRQPFKTNADEFAPSLFSPTKNPSSNAVAQDDKKIGNRNSGNDGKDNLQNKHSLTDTLSIKSRTGSNHSAKTRKQDNSSKSTVSTTAQGTHTTKHVSSQTRSVLQTVSEENSTQSTISIKNKNSSLSMKKEDIFLQENGKEKLQKSQGDNASVYTNSEYTCLSAGSSPSKAPSYFTIGSDADEDRIVRLEESLRREEDATRTVKKTLSELKERQEKLLKRLGPHDRN
jgi:hypothetical protein